MMKTKEDDYSSFVGLIVRDAELMLGFYQDVLGMKLVSTDTGDAGMTKYYLTFTGGMLKMFAPDSPPEKGSKDVMGVSGYRLNTFLVSNMAELFKELTEKGVRIITPMQSSGGDQKWGIIADPEGNLIEIAGTG